ncbi:MAG TPA: PA14 domain-containing protein, partial [Polyangia bacterium]|nr:PA14 domain-containing protein [Polyangia bacterium]
MPLLTKPHGLRARTRAVASALALGLVAGACSSSPGGTSGTGGGQAGGAMATGTGGSGASATGGTQGSGTGGAVSGGAGGTVGSGGTGATVGRGGVGGSSATGGAGGGSTPNIPILSVGCGMLKIEVCTDDIIRVACAPSAAFFSRASVMTSPKKCVDTPAQVTTAAGQMTITTDRLSVRVDTTTGAVTFLDSAGTTILAEQPGGGRTLTAATIQGEATHNIRQEWQPQSDESLYGLGQHQQGHFDIKGYDLDLHQQNSEVFIPYLVSSRGYGILWDNTSYTRFGDLGQPQPVPGVTYAAGTPANTVQGATSGSVNWQGMVTATTAGDYEFFTYASGNVQLDVNNQTLVNHWRQNWLPNVEIAKVALQAGQQVPVHLQWTADSGVNLLQFGWKPQLATPRTTSLWSEVGDGID